MDTRVIPWTIEISDICTQLRVGILDHEREFQPIRISVSIRAIASASPQTIEDCLDYQPICRWITEEWPEQPHTPLLETKLRELMSFIFSYDSRVVWTDVAISKPMAIPAAFGVGVRMALSRADHEKAFMPRESVAREKGSYFAAQPGVYAHS